MAKKSFYVCSSCGHREPKWMGRCSACGEWNTLTEQAPEIKKTNRQHRQPAAQSRRLADIPVETAAKRPAGITELDRVIGGGIMPGSSVLVGGEPGIGKSTLMLQFAASVDGTALYVSGEESGAQIRQRADRLGLDSPVLHILCTSDLAAILEQIRQLQPVLIVIDSIQTILASEAGAVPGTVNQIKFCAHEIIDSARECGGAAFLIAHVTKEGIIAGPKNIEHMVDTVLYFDHGEADARFLRAVKNRFGSVDEVGLFTMGEKGLAEIGNAGSFFMVRRDGEQPAGTVSVPVHEGSRILLVEIQALTVPAKSGFSRVYSDRVDSNRISRIAAVLEKHLNLSFSDQDIYVNVAGGLRIRETAADLALALVLYSARTGIPLPAGTACAGEITLSGEIRSIPHLARRVRSVNEMGYTACLVPPNADGVKAEDRAVLRCAADLKAAVKIVFPTEA